MRIPSIDTHTQVKAFQKTGFTEKQAEAIVDLLFETITYDDLTKIDKQKHIKAIQEIGVTKKQAATIVKLVFGMKEAVSHKTAS